MGRQTFNYKSVSLEIVSANATTTAAEFVIYTGSTEVIGTLAVARFLLQAHARAIGFFFSFLLGNAAAFPEETAPGSNPCYPLPDSLRPRSTRDIRYIPFCLLLDSPAPSSPPSKISSFSTVLVAGLGLPGDDRIENMLIARTAITIISLHRSLSYTTYRYSRILADLMRCLKHFLVEIRTPERLPPTIDFRFENRRSRDTGRCWIKEASTGGASAVFRDIFRDESHVTWNKNRWPIARDPPAPSPPPAHVARLRREHRTVLRLILSCVIDNRSLDPRKKEDSCAKFLYFLLPRRV